MIHEVSILCQDLAKIEDTCESCENLTAGVWLEQPSLNGEFNISIYRHPIMTNNTQIYI